MSVGHLPRPYAGVADRAPRGVLPAQQVAEVPGEEVVVFLIGMRINRLRKVRSWWGAFVGMPRMLAELAKHPEDGLLHARTLWSGRTFMVVQYWESVEKLGRYARNAERAHAPAWAAFNRGPAATGDVGIFHETYVVPREGVETLYANLPALGLGAAHGAVPRPARRSRRAEKRVGGEVADVG
ncbi:DUF4188 domain-containing protein [Nocardioides caldifontis]|uniref:DUF4188 domain-containing protein n=1 Tax=Nocardioides caldifontis TaxID=2588938 RepID=UPI0011DFF3C5|nr:DUF4188 domain-containing protein [Nocardioides caldifontis]